MITDLSSLHTDGASPSTTPTAVELTKGDFGFAHYPNVDRFFRGPRPLELFHSPPPLVTYHDVIYTPAMRGGMKQRLGCLYDADGRRIHEALTFRTRSDTLFNTDPEQYEGRTDDLPVFDRPVLYMGHIRPHFGHFTMETLASWWALTEENLDVEHYLFHMYTPDLLKRIYARESVGAFQFNEANMLTFDRPMKLKKVIVPQSSFQLLSHIHTKYRDLCNKLSIALGTERMQPSDQPVMLSRRFDTHGVRQYKGQEKVEEFLASRGVRVVAPNQLTFAEQFQLTNAHKTIIGFQGSQMANIIGALEPRKVIYLTDHKACPNWFLIDRVFDHESTYINVCETDEGLSRMYRLAKKKITGKRYFKDGFQVFHQVDADKAIAWFKSSGII